MPLTWSASRHSGRDCESLGTWRGRTSALSGDTRRENRIASLRSRPNSCILRWTSSLRAVQQRPVPPRKPPARSRLSWRRIPILSGTALSRVFARPGGNITGLATLAPELSGKKLELMKELVPKLSRVAVLGTSTRSGNARSLKEAELAARALGVKLHYLDILSPKDIEPAFRAAAKGRADAVLVLTSPFATSQRTTFTGLAAKTRLPTIYDRTEFVEDGGLMTYSVSSTDLFRRAATYTDKILEGAN